MTVGDVSGAPETDGGAPETDGGARHAPPPPRRVIVLMPASHICRKHSIRRASMLMRRRNARRIALGGPRAARRGHRRPGQIPAIPGCHCPVWQHPDASASLVAAQLQGAALAADRRAAGGDSGGRRTP